MERGAGGWMEVRGRLVDGGVREVGVGRLACMVCLVGVGRLACGLSCVWAVVNTVSCGRVSAAWAVGRAVLNVQKMNQLTSRVCMTVWNGVGGS